VITGLVCSLRGLIRPVTIMPGTLAHQAYGKDRSDEEFACSYGVNPEYHDRLFSAGLRLSGVGPEGEARIAELSNHRFFVGTLFLPQCNSAPERPHPLIVAWLKAAMDFPPVRLGEANAAFNPEEK
jgi:CTP synthase (UTP-ammonia lyase)